MLVVVTGASGRIGQGVAAELVAAGHSVRAVDVAKPAAPAAWAASERVTWQLVDLSAEAAEAQLRGACEGADALVHLAAVPDDAPFLERLLPVNIVGLYRVLEAAREAPSLRRVVVASSGKIYWGYGYGNKSTDGMPLGSAAPPKPVCLCAPLSHPHPFPSPFTRL